MKRIFALVFLVSIVHVSFAQRYELTFDPQKNNSETELYIQHKNMPKLENAKQRFIIEKTDRGRSDFSVLTALKVNEFISATGVTFNIEEYLTKYEGMLQNMQLDKKFTMHGREGMDFIYSLYKEGDSYKIVFYLGKEADKNAFLLKEKK